MSLNFACAYWSCTGEAMSSPTNRTEEPNNVSLNKALFRQNQAAPLNDQHVQLNRKCSSSDRVVQVELPNIFSKRKMNSPRKAIKNRQQSCVDDVPMKLLPGTAAAGASNFMLVNSCGLVFMHFVCNTTLCIGNECIQRWQDCAFNSMHCSCLCKQ